MTALLTAEHVVYTSDCWTDDYAHNQYLGITAHFINQEWCMQSHVLQTVHLDGKATGDVINKHFTTVLREWQLQRVSRSLVTDEGSNILRAGRLGGWHQLECFAHRLDLCITDYGLDKVEGAKGVIKKCKDIVMFLRYKSSEVRGKQQELSTLMETVVENDHTYGAVTTEIATTSLKR